MAAKRLFVACDTCAGSPRPGLLPLGRGDWLKCPRGCSGGRIEMIEEHVKPRGKMFIPGDTKGVVLHHPAHAKRFQ